MSVRRLALAGALAAAGLAAAWNGDLAGMRATFDHGIPLTKPPYGQLTAIDLNAGTIRCRSATGPRCGRIPRWPA